MVRVKTRQYNKRGVKGWEVDVTIHFPDGLPPYRIRKKSPMNTRLQSHDWGMSLGQRIAGQGRPGREKVLATPVEPVLTFKEFAKVYIDRWLIEEEFTKSTLALRERQLNKHFLPMIGDLPLDQITDQTVATIKTALRKKSDGTDRSGSHRNGLMQLLGHMLKKAYEWKLLRTPPPERASRVKVIAPEIEIYDEGELARLVIAAKELGAGPHLMVLLGCEAGLRVGEMLGLRWSDIDLEKRRLVVRQQVTKAKETTAPKSRKSRIIPLSDALYSALKSSRGLTERVLLSRSGEPVSRSGVAKWLKSAELRAKLIGAKSPHKLRHTFASRLLSRGASLVAVKELLGHKSLQTTMMYLHLMPSETEAAIRKLSGDKPETKDNGVRR